MKNSLYNMVRWFLVSMGLEIVTILAVVTWLVLF